MHEDFQRFRASFLPDLNLSQKKKKKRLHNVSLLSERQGFIAYDYTTTHYHTDPSRGDGGGGAKYFVSVDPQ